MDRLRAEIDASVQAARDRVSRRLYGRPTPSRVKDLLQESHRRARDLLRKPGAEPTAKPPPELTVHDLHTIERLLSYVRHSIVRICFYNLKLFAPSLVDEYDTYVRDQVIANMNQLDGARREIAFFFDQRLADGRKIGGVLPRVPQQTFQDLDALIALANAARDHLDDPAVRQRLAAEAPRCIDAVMDSLQLLQADLDARKIAVNEVIEEAVNLTRPVAEENGLTLEIDARPAPRVFANRAQLLNAFVELITNAMKHGRGTRLRISVAPAVQVQQQVCVKFEDDGRGMGPDEIQACVHRGVSTGGTGEGLPMVLQIVEADHLGALEIAGRPGDGCCFEIRLPVKFSPGKE
jgi:signal transduction histidine kinase